MVLLSSRRMWTMLSLLVHRLILIIGTASLGHHAPCLGSLHTRLSPKGISTSEDSPCQTQHCPSMWPIIVAYHSYDHSAIVPRHQRHQKGKLTAG